MTSIKTDTIISLFNGISGLILLILFAQSAGLLLNSIYLLLKPKSAEEIYLGADIAQLFSLGKMHFSTIFILTVTISILKVYSFLLTMMIFSTLKAKKPFSEEIGLLVSKVSYTILAVGILGKITYHYSEWLETLGFELKKLQSWWDDNLAYLMIGIIVFVLAQIFKKGLELQAENDLTV